MFLVLLLWSNEQKWLCLPSALHWVNNEQMSNALGFSNEEKIQLPTNKKKLQEWIGVLLSSEIFIEVAEGEEVTLLGKEAVVNTDYS